MHANSLQKNTKSQQKKPLPNKQAATAQSSKCKVLKILNLAIWF